MLSIGKQIAQYIEDTYNYTVSPAICQLFYVLTRPFRRALLGYIEVLIAQLYVQKGAAVLLTKRGDVVSNNVKNLTTAVNTMLEPLDKFFATFPLDTVALEVYDELAIGNAKDEVIGDIAGDVPLKIPASVWTALKTASGVENLEFFNGINSYSDLRDKIDELEFRAARATALSNYAANGVAYYQNKIEKLEVYKLILYYLGV